MASKAVKEDGRAGTTGAIPQNPGRTTPVPPTIQVGNQLLVSDNLRFAGSRIPPLFSGKPGTITAGDWILITENHLNNLGITEDAAKIAEAKLRIDATGPGKGLTSRIEFESWTPFKTTLLEGTTSGSRTYNALFHNLTNSVWNSATTEFLEFVYTTKEHTTLS